MNQIDLLYELFEGFLEEESSQDFDFDNGLVCRWFNGQARISPRISGYYLHTDNRNRLADDIETNILPLMCDSAMAIQEIYKILIQDGTISDQKKEQLTQDYPCHTSEEQAAFLASVLCFGMERTFVKRNAATKKLLAAGTLSPVISDFVYNGEVPKACAHFCGRNQELSTLHELISEKRIIFLQGIAGIGKSELAKAYARAYRKDYTNILYLTYSGDLRQDIIDLDFVDDLPEDTEEDRFRKHNRFLRSLKEDTLLIIDNFNTTAGKDAFFSVLLKYRCRILFTTRSRFDNYASFNLGEISDPDALLSLMGYFYSDAKRKQSILKQIIQTVHSHTLAVELSARLLETGILEPQELLARLQVEKSALGATDTIDIVKDGQSRKATYYEHIHTLFSLYRLSEEELNIMRGLIFVPVSGVSGRLYANWMKLSDMNRINDLIEKGFVQTQSGRQISLHPMIQEVAIDETRPSVNNSAVLLDSLQTICLLHGHDVTWYKPLFLTIENIIREIADDNTPAYLSFLEDVFPYMEKYHYTAGMELIIGKLSGLLTDETVGRSTDRAVLLDYRAACEEKTEKAIKLEKEAIALIPEISEENAHLVSNLYSNLGGLYKKAGKRDLAQQAMEQGLRILEQYDLLYYHDSIAQTANYAVLLTEMGQPEKGLSALKKLSRMIRDLNSDQTMDYATVQEAIGGICLATGDIRQATTHFKKALAIYEAVHNGEPDMIETKKQEILQAYTQTGIALGQQLLNN
ncbi:tetratricopeptide repeat protein [[Ruminococcus] torques]|nr:MULTISPECIES: tetratricopeptide repeat protein [Lachnospiraceae]MCB5922951.1 tetratricopeptide repeat protein [Faecalicatena fissicatena]MDU2935271.1 tetratricopeptide repeat protein [Clostridiales bacterium]MBS6791942.1 tetratricopeptide repeat protein [[Ruminococcus] lactaris]MCB7249834.1 tetratricopeptide repeat protein [[Ruminococcus] torques]MCC2814537.1 tetratricopeptide repeat protein [Faecalicatena fissicatena]